MKAKRLLKDLKKEISKNYQINEAESITYLILESLYKFSRTEIVLDKEIIFNNNTQRQIDNIIQRLKKGEPIQYILNEAWFYGLKFHVDPAVLIPRPETEFLVDIILKENPYPNLHVLDICTGSGCIAVTLAKNLANASITAIDKYPEVLEIAKLNAEKNQTQITFFNIDILTEKIPTNGFDIIVSNPPYVLKSEMISLDKKVVEHEPHDALFIDDADPLIFYKKIMESARDLLAEKGKLYFEINEQFGESLRELLLDNGFKNVRIIKDLQNKDRIAAGTL